VNICDVDHLVTNVDSGGQHEEGASDTEELPGENVHGAVDWERLHGVCNTLLGLRKKYGNVERTVSPSAPELKNSGAALKPSSAAVDSDAEVEGGNYCAA